MASITIRNLDEDVKARLRVRAAENNRSMEAEARSILLEAVSQQSSPRNLADAVQFHFGPINGVDLELPSRELGRSPLLID